MSTTLIIPGLGNSSADHWQSWWQAQDPEAIRVHQDDWNNPDLEHWTGNISEHLETSFAPVWIVAHSFGCLAAVLAASRKAPSIAGLFLVAPADPQRFDLAHLLPQESIKAPVVVAASTNDPWLKLMTAMLWTQRWGGRLVNLGAAGHVNPDSGFGPWVEGRMVFTAFQRSMEGWLHGDIDAGPDRVKRHPVDLSAEVT